MKAKVQMVTVEAICPSCGGTLIDPDNGSLYINVNQYNKGDVFMCNECGERFELEAKAWK